MVLGRVLNRRIATMVYGYSVCVCVQADFDRCWVELCNFLVDFIRDWAMSADSGHISAECGPQSSEFFPNWPDLDVISSC